MKRFLALAVLASSATLHAADPDGLITFNSNGGWCWYQDERALIHNGKLIIGSVANSKKGDQRHGDIDVTVFDLATKQAKTVELHDRLEADDHNVPAFLPLPDGRILTSYAKHGTDKVRRYRVSKPGDPTQWEPVTTFSIAAGLTYSNLYRLSEENGGKGRIYDFHRGVGWNPNYLISDDDGKTWAYGGRLIGVDKERPYPRYTSNGRDTIHFITTEAHPNEFDGTSIYHGYIKGGKVYRSDGAEAGALPTSAEAALSITQLTKVFAGDVNNEAWTSSIRLDPQGRPYIGFTTHKTDDDHRYHFARWDGKAWQVNEIAHAGSRLYKPEVHYTGNIAVDPHDAGVLYISTNADPVSGAPLISKADNKRHYEVFRGASADGGKTWKFTAITSDSTQDNLRPIVPPSDGKGRAVLWLRGEYRTYTNYTLSIVGLVSEAK